MKNKQQKTRKIVGVMLGVFGLFLVMAMVGMTLSINKVKEIVVARVDSAVLASAEAKAETSILTETEREVGQTMGQEIAMEQDAGQTIGRETGQVIGYAEPLGESETTLPDMTRGFVIMATVCGMVIVVCSMLAVMAFRRLMGV